MNLILRTVVSQQVFAIASPVRTRSSSRLQAVLAAGRRLAPGRRSQPIGRETRTLEPSEMSTSAGSHFNAGQILLGQLALPSFRQVAVVCPGRDSTKQFIKSMFLNKVRGELLVVSVKEDTGSVQQSRGAVFMQLRSLRLRTLICASQGNVVPAVSLDRQQRQNVHITAATPPPSMQFGNVSPAVFTPDESPASSQGTPGAPPMSTPDGYRAAHIPVISTVPLLANEPEKSISHEGWCEFDDSRQLFITMSTREQSERAPPARNGPRTPRVHAATTQRYLRVWSLADYRPIFTLCCDSGIFKPGGDEFDDIKLAQDLLLVVCKRAPQAAFIVVHVYSLANGSHTHRLMLPLEPALNLQSLECMADRIVLKQYKQPVKLFDIRGGGMTASLATPNNNRVSPSYVFLGAHQLLLLFMSRRVRTISLSGRVVADMDVLHCTHGASCSTTNVFVAEDQRTVYGYCSCLLHAVYNLSVVCVISGRRIHEWSSEDTSLPPAVRHSLRDITSLYVHQHASLMLTGHADGTVNSWVPRGTA